MRVPASVAAAVAGLLMFGWPAPATAQSPTGEGRSGWYVGGGVGVNWASDINQRGSNRDTLCYPVHACFDEDPRSEQSGYRWAYDLATGAGAQFELATGFTLGRARLELSFAQRRNDIEQMFRPGSVTDFAGSPLVRRSGNTVTSDAEYWIDNLTVRTLAVNAYYHFRDATGTFSPYVGVGIGPAFAQIRGLHYAEQYRDNTGNGTAYDPPLSFYTSRQDADFSDTLLAGHLHAGTDFRVTDRTALGVKLTYTVLGDIEATGTYQVHAQHAMDADFSNHTGFTGTRYRTVLFTIRYVLGG